MGSLSLCVLEVITAENADFQSEYNFHTHVAHTFRRYRALERVSLSEYLAFSLGHVSLKCFYLLFGLCIAIASILLRYGYNGLASECLPCCCTS
jgi:hypothetical protein